MTYDIAHYWPLLLIALVIGGFVGGATWVEGHREGPLSRWMTGWMPAAALCFIIGLLLAVSHILRGRPGLWLETALLAFVFYVAGCFVGGWLRAIGLESQAALSSGAAGATLFFRRGPGWIDREGRVSGRERAALDAHDRAVAALDEKAAGLDATASSAAEVTAAAVAAGLPASEPGGGAFFRPGPGWVDREGRSEGRERAALDDRERSLAAAEGTKPGAVAPTPDRVVPAPTIAPATAQDARTAGPSTGTVPATPAAPATPDDHVAAATPSSSSTTQAAVNVAGPPASTGAAAGSIAAATSAVAASAKSGAAEPSAATTTPSTSSSGSASAQGGSPEGLPVEPTVSPSTATSTPEDTAATRSGGSPPPAAPSSDATRVKPADATGSMSSSESSSPTATSTGSTASSPMTASTDVAAGKEAVPVSDDASKTPAAQPAPSKGPLVSAPAAAEGASTEKASSPSPSVGSPSLASQTPASTPAVGDAASGTFSGGGSAAAAPSSPQVAPTAPLSPQGAPPSKPSSDQASLFGDEAAPTGDANPPVSSAPSSAAAGSAPPASAVAPAAGTAADPSATHPGEKPSALDTARGGTPDNLKLIKGIGPKNEAACNALGVYHFSQIADWSPQNAAWVGHHIAFPGRIEREHWIPQAKLLALGIDTAHSAGVRSGAIKVDASADTPLSEAEAAAVHADMPALAAPVDGEDKHAGARPLGFAAPQGGTADDLKRIKGIGKQNEARLHGLGVWHFDQIAGWTADNVKWVGSYLAFPGRITREQWIVQAAELAAGRETPFSTRVAAGLVKTSVDDGSKGQGNVSKAPPRAT